MTKVSCFLSIGFISACGLLVIGCDSAKKSSGAETPLSGETKVSQTQISQVVSDEADANKPSPQEPKMEKKWELILNVPEEPIVLEDLSQVQVREGVEPPPIGTTIYPMSKLPNVECGRFWIFFGDGFIDHVYACNHGEEGHQH